MSVENFIQSKILCTKYLTVENNRLYMIVIYWGTLVFCMARSQSYMYITSFYKDGKLLVSRTSSGTQSLALVRLPLHVALHLESFERPQHVLLHFVLSGTYPFLEVIQMIVLLLEISLLHPAWAAMMYVWCVTQLWDISHYAMPTWAV